MACLPIFSPKSQKPRPSDVKDHKNYYTYRIVWQLNLLQRSFSLATGSDDRTVLSVHGADIFSCCKSVTHLVRQTS